MTPETIPHDILFITAMRAALKAGEAIMQVYEGQFDAKIKADGSPVTMADMRANEVICRDLHETRLPVISEENKAIAFAERQEWPLFWLVDPLDGTKEFINRNGEFTVNIALIKDSLPVMGIITAPALGQAWFADGINPPGKINNTRQLNLSADTITSQDINRHAMPMSATRNTDQAIVAVSRSHLDKKTKRLAALMAADNANVKMHPKGSSLKLCDLADHKATFYPRFTPCYEWDTAAGHAILRAAGGEIFGMESRKILQYNKADVLNPAFIAFADKSDSGEFFAKFSF